MPLEEEKIRGQQAEALLNNPMLELIFQQLKEFYIKEWSETDYLNVDAREHAYNMHVALQKIRDEIDTYISSGKFASQQINEFVRKKR